MIKKVCEVFSKEYREETEYREYMEKMLHHFALNNKSESVEEKVNRLIENSFTSDFKVSIGEYE